MDIEKIVAKLSQSPEFIELIQKTAESEVASQTESVNVREVKRARMMEPLRDEGEWLLNPGEAGDD